jgi:hypothetical protein
VICQEQNISTKGSKFDIIQRLCNTKRVDESIHKRPETIRIYKDFFGNFVHEDTGFVFNKDTQLVIGKENDQGEVNELTRKDIEICHKWKFRYVLPKYLDDPQKNEYMYEVLLQKPNYSQTIEQDNEEEQEEENEDENDEHLFHSSI